MTAWYQSGTTARQLTDVCATLADGRVRASRGRRPLCLDSSVTVPHCDLVVRGGTLLTPGHQEIADVGIRDGQIAQLGGPITGEDEVDATGLPVFPGGIDAHVHLVGAGLAEATRQQGPIWVDDFWTGSLAALAGGITTVGNMTFALPGESVNAAVAREMADAAAEAAVDWFLHPVLTVPTENSAAEIAGHAADGPASRCLCPIPVSRRRHPAWQRP